MTTRYHALCRDCNWRRVARNWSHAMGMGEHHEQDTLHIVLFAVSGGESGKPEAPLSKL